MLYILDEINLTDRPIEGLVNLTFIKIIAMSLTQRTKKTQLELPTHIFLAYIRK